MKKMGTSRKIDELGRIVLPIDIRRALGLEQGDAVDIFADKENQTITLKKTRPACCGCGNGEKLHRLPNGQYLCAACLEQIK